MSWKLERLIDTYVTLTVTNSLIGLALIAFIGCGDNDLPPTPLPTPAPLPTQSFKNPDCMGEMPFKHGMLWKPCSESQCKLVVLIDESFVNEFLSCRVTLKNGEDEFLHFTGFSNGNRQTWRGAQNGDKYKDNGAVVCTEMSQACVWRFTGDSGERHE